MKFARHACPLLLIGVLSAALPLAARGQDSAPDAETQTGSISERWNLHLQATAIGQNHGPFNSPYAGVNSLESRRETKASLTTTFFLGARLWKGAELYVNPEVAGGRGLSNVTGISGFPNGDITRVVSPAPKPYLSRLFLRQTWGLGRAEKTQAIEGGANQLAGREPVSRFTLTLGKISVVDIFDSNTYSHDPRAQFLNWSLMNTGTWDYPADTRGYTVGVAAELNHPGWALRAGSFMVPRVANGLDLDHHIRRNHAEVAELELRRTTLGQPGKVKLLGFINHANMGTYRAALLETGHPPDITLTQRPGTPKYGFGVNVEQALTADLGAFLRFGWDDGKTETWAFTEIDRSVGAGLELKGKRWRRWEDALGVALVRNSLSPAHRDYLAAGGHGFILGDGRLNPAAERILEAYYALRLGRGFTLSPDYQFAANPGDNRDRGPVSIWGFRLHWEQ